MLAFRKAEEAGADGIELDVHLSSDGEVMIMHDEALKRTAGKSGVISDYTRSELEKINAGKTKNDEFGFTPIPSLEEFLSWLKGTDLYVNIELKTAPVYYPGIEEKTVALVSRFSLEDRVIYSSFNWLSIFILQKLGVKSEKGLLFDGMVLKKIAYALKEDNLDYYHPSFKLLSDEAVKDFKDNGIGLNVWTVNDESEIRQCIKWDINGLITNEPEKARRILS